MSQRKDHDSNEFGGDELRRDELRRDELRLVDYHQGEMNPRDRLAFEREMGDSDGLRIESDGIFEILSLFSCLGERAPGFRAAANATATSETAASDTSTWDAIEEGCWVIDRLPAYVEHRQRTEPLTNPLADREPSPELSAADLARIERAVADSPFLAVESAEIEAALAAWRGAQDPRGLERFAPGPAVWDELARRITVHDQLIEYHRGELTPAQCAQVRCAVERSEALGVASDEIARVMKGVSRLGGMEPPASTWDRIVSRLDDVATPPAGAMPDESPPPARAPAPAPAPAAARTPALVQTPIRLATTTIRGRPIAGWRARLLLVSVAALSAWGVATAWRGSREIVGSGSEARLIAGTAQIESPNGTTSPLSAGIPARHLEPGDHLVTGDDRARIVLGPSIGVRGSALSGAPGERGASGGGASGGGASGGVPVTTLVLEAATDVELVGPGRLALRRGRILLASSNDASTHATVLPGGASSWVVAVAGLECRLLGTEVDFELARDVTRIQVLDGRVIVAGRAGGSASELRVEREIIAGSGLEIPHLDVSGATPETTRLASALFAVEPEHVRTGWLVESLVGRLRIIQERDARGVRRIALLTLTNTTSERVQLVAAGSTRRCWLVIDARHGGGSSGGGSSGGGSNGGGGSRGGIQIPLVLDGPSAQRDALDGGASHAFRIDVTDHFGRPGSYDVCARYLVGRAARDVGSPAHSVTTPVFTLVVE